MSKSKVSVYKVHKMLTRGSRTMAAGCLRIMNNAIKYLNCKLLGI